MLTKKWGVLLDLDQTLVLTDAIEPLRRARAWPKVYNSFGKTTLPAGTAEFIAEVSQLAKLGIVTTSPRSYAERLLAYHRLHLPVLVAYHDVAHRKPDPEPILKAAALLDLQPAKCIHVGDQAGDIEAAIRAGAIGVALSWDRSLNRGNLNRRIAGFCANWDEVYRVVADVLASNGRIST
jgi:HAD superfamily hydrolase (TIGR01549 family)